MTKSKKNFQFEKSLDELEKIVNTLESGDLSLEKSLEQFEKGIKITHDCTQALNHAEQTIKKLVETNENLQLEDFTIDDEQGEE